MLTFVGLLLMGGTNAWAQDETLFSFTCSSTEQTGDCTPNEGTGTITLSNAPAKTSTYFGVKFDKDTKNANVNLGTTTLQAGDKITIKMYAASSSDGTNFGMKVWNNNSDNPTTYYECFVPSGATKNVPSPVVYTIGAGSPLIGLSEFNVVRATKSSVFFNGITIVRPDPNVKSSDASVASIVVNDKYKATASGTDYTVAVLNGGNTGDAITAMVKPTDAKATVVDATFDEGTGQYAVAAKVGKDNGVNFVVKAEDGTQVTYKITVLAANDITRDVDEFHVKSGNTYVPGQKITCPDIVAMIAETSDAAGNKMGNTESAGISTVISETNYKAYVNGQVNPGYTGFTATSGSYYAFTPSKNGVLELGININSGREFFILDGSRRLVNGTDFTTALYNSSTHAEEQLDANNKLANKADGMVTINVEADKTYYVFCKSSKLGWYGMEFTPAAETVSVSVGADGFASFCSTKTIDITGSEIEAYWAKDITGNDLTMEKISVIPAGTGVILKSVNGGAASFDGVVTETEDEITGNLLVGTTEDTDVSVSTEGSYNYIFGKGNEGIGFYKLATSNHTVKAGKAYLHLTTEAPSSTKGITMHFGNDATGINEVVGHAAETTNTYYTLSGVRVQNPQKGLYIVNGKKVVLK